MARSYPWQRKRRRIIIAILAVLVIPGAFTAYRAYYEGKLERRLTEIAATGAPVTLGELARFLPAGDEAVRVGQAYGELQGSFRLSREHMDRLPFFGRTKDLPLNAPYPEAQRIAMQAFLEENAACLDELHTAAALGACRLTTSFAVARNLGLPDLGALRQHVQLLCIEGLAAAEEGRKGAAVQALLAALRITEWLAPYPVHMCQSVRMRMLGDVREALSRLLSRVALGDGQLRKLEGALSVSDIHEGLQLAIVGERCFFIHRLRYLGVFPGAEHLAQEEAWRQLSVGNKVLLSIPNLSGWTTVDLLHGLDFFGQLAEAAERPWPAILGQAEEMQRAARQLPNLRAYRTKGTARQLARNLPAFAEQAARLRSMRTALAIERYRLVRGLRPGSLEPLVPRFIDEIPRDPFNGEALRYRKRKTGYCVYSVGKNRIDNTREVHSTRKGRRHAGDLVFEVMR